MVEWFERLDTVPVNVPLIFVDVRVFIVIALIVPPSILSPLIWLSASVSVPPDISIVPLLIVSLYYLFDSTLTLIIRLIKKKDIFEAHSDHFYQKILRAGQTHRQVLNKITILLGFLFIFSMISIRYPLLSLILAIITTLGFLVFVQRRYKDE